MDNLTPYKLPESVIPNFHYYSDLSCNFWDTENIINKKYKKQKEKSISNKKIEVAYKTLIDQNQREAYQRKLFYFYISSQPTTFYQLIKSNFSLIYPLLVFRLSNAICDEYYLVLDFINFTVCVYTEKYQIKKMIEIQTVEDIEQDQNNIALVVSENKDNVTLITPEIFTQTELIYVLIIFMAGLKKKLDSFKNESRLVKEINQNLIYKRQKTISGQKIIIEEKADVSQLKILEDDSFIPSSIKVASFAHYDKPKKGKEFDVFITLGSGNLIIFKNDKLEDFTKIIPVAPGYVIFEFKNENNLFKVKTVSEDFLFYLPDIQTLNEFKKVTKNIYEGKYNNVLTFGDLEKICLNKCEGKISEENKISEQFNFSISKEIENLNQEIQNLNTKKEKIVAVFKEQEEFRNRKKRVEDIFSKKEGQKKVEEESPNLDDNLGSLKSQILLEKE